MTRKRQQGGLRPLPASARARFASRRRRVSTQRLDELEERLLEGLVYALRRRRELEFYRQVAHDQIDMIRLVRLVRLARVDLSRALKEGL